MQRPRHATILFDRAAVPSELPQSFRDAIYVTPWAKAPFPFDELVCSWNVAGAAFRVEVQVRTDEPDASESPWLEIGTWGKGVALDAHPCVLEFDGGRIDVDFFRARGEHRFAAARLRFTAVVGVAGECRLERYGLTFTQRGGATGSAALAPRAAPSAVDLSVPFRSQKSAGGELAGRICSPTSLSMVLAYRGVDRSPAEVAAAAYDERNDLYGNWPRSVQCAFAFGVPGYLTRFDDWNAVYSTLEAGQPIIASIGVKSGQLDGAPYHETSGHLIVLTGFDAHGDLRVNDPAVADPEQGKRVYRKDQLDVVWMLRGGTAYILLPRDNPSKGTR